MARRTPKFNVQQPAAPAVLEEAPAKAGTVCVCSHFHRGVIFNMPDGRKVRIAGVNDSLRGKEHAKIIVGGGVYTRIPEDDWNYIAKAFKDWAAISKGLIYAEKSTRDAKAAIKERAELRDGFEPVNPEKAKTIPTTSTEAA